MMIFTRIKSVARRRRLKIFTFFYRYKNFRFDFFWTQGKKKTGNVGYRFLKVLKMSVGIAFNAHI